MYQAQPFFVKNKLILIDLFMKIQYNIYNEWVFAIKEMGRFYRHVLIEKNYPHHGAVAFGHYGKALFEVFKYIGVPVEDINYNQPASLPYKTENPFC